MPWVGRNVSKRPGRGERSVAAGFAAELAQLSGRLWSTQKGSPDLNPPIAENRIPFPIQVRVAAQALACRVVESHRLRRAAFHWDAVQLVLKKLLV
jgi:hypothetical protein